MSRVGGRLSGGRCSSSVALCKRGISVVACPSVCPSVCHTPTLYGNDWTDQAGLGVGASLHPSCEMI